MDSLGFPGVIFLSAAQINAQDQTMLSWDQIRTMKKKGWEFGSHTLNHVNLDHCSLNQAEEELTLSKKYIDTELNEDISIFAYPYGKGYKNTVLRELIRKCGYHAACAIRRDLESVPVNDLYQVKRVLVRGDDSFYDFKLSLKKGRSRC